jgi:hypothetical protein
LAVALFYTQSVLGIEALDEIEGDRPPAPLEDFEKGAGKFMGSPVAQSAKKT